MAQVAEQGGKKPRPDRPGAFGGTTGGLDLSGLARLAAPELSVLELLRNLQGIGGDLPVIGMNTQQRERERQAAELKEGDFTIGGRVRDGRVPAAITAPEVATPNYQPFLDSKRRGGTQYPDLLESEVDRVANQQRNAEQLRANAEAALNIAMTSLGTKRLGAKADAKVGKKVVGTPGFLRTAEDLITERGGRAPEVAAANPQAAEKYAGNINLQRIGAPDEVKAQIKLAQEQITRPPAQSHDETVAFARETLLAAKLAGRDPLEMAASFAGRQLRREEVTAIRIAAAEQATNAATSAREAVKGGLTPEAVVKAEKEILKHLSMQETLSGVTREAGGTLDSFNIVVNAEQGQFAVALDKLGRLKDRQDFISRLARIDPTDQERVSKFIRDVEVELQKGATKAAAPVDWQWWLNHTYVNGIMSGLSNVRNLLGNTLKVAKTVAEVYGASALPNGPSLSAANALTSALVTRGLSRGAGKFWHVFKHRLADDFEKLDDPYQEIVRYPQNPVGAKIADVIGLPGRAMLAIDGFFKGAWEEAFKHYYAAEEAAGLGLSGERRTAYIAQRVDSPDLDLVRKSRDAAREMTYNATAGPKTTRVRELRDSIPGSKLFVTFINTPANIYRDALQSSPLGLPPVAALQAKVTKGHIGELVPKGAFGEAETAVRYSRAILGTGLMAGVYWAMAEGKLTGFNPYKPGTTEWELWNKDNLEVAMKTPWGDISLLNYPPFSTLFKFVATQQETARKYGEDAVSDPLYWAQSALRLFYSGIDESFFANVSDVFAAKENPDRFLKPLVQRLVTSPLPYSGALRLISNVQGIGPREAGSFDEYLAAAIPALAQNMDPRLGALGPLEPRTNQGPLALIPSRVQQPHATEFERRLLYLRDNFGLTLPEPLQRDVGRGVKLTDDELYELKKNTYPKILDAMHKVMTATDFNTLPEAEQVRRLREAFDAARADGKVETAWSALLPRAKTPEEVTRVALIGLSSYTKLADKAKWISDISKVGKMTPEAARMIDEARPVKAPGVRPDPTVDEYVRFAPRIREYLATKPFLVGNAEEWRRLEVARREYEAAKSANALAPKPALVRKYELSSVKNPKRGQLLSRYPGLERFVGDATYRWEP